MASGTISGSTTYDGTNRYVDFTISSDYGSSSCSWSCRSYSTTGYQPKTRIALYVNGSCVNDSGYVANWTTYPTGKDYTISGTCTVPASGTISFSFGAGVGHNNTTDIQQSGSILKVGTPSINTPTISNIGRNTANASFSVSNNAGHSITDNYIDCGTYNFGNVISTIFSTSGTFSGLTPNTTYYVRANASNGTYRGYSSVKSFTTIGNAPKVYRGTVTPTRTTCSITPTVEYDTNDSYSSKTIVYGTTSNYGNTSEDGVNLTGLTPNTNYYYKVSVTSSRGRTGIYEGQFQTLGNAPSIQRIIKIGEGSGYGIELNADVIYDTNASFKSIYIKYGTNEYCVEGTSHEWCIPENFTKTVESGMHEELSYHNTRCYFKMRITDNYERVSDWMTGSFLTTGNKPIIERVAINEVKSKSINISISNIIYDTNASINYSDIYVTLNGEQAFHSRYDGTTHDLDITNLKPGKLYKVDAAVVDTFGKVSDSYTEYVKTKGGFKCNGRMSDTIKINGKEVIGMKYNGIEII